MKCNKNEKAKAYTLNPTSVPTGSQVSPSCWAITWIANKTNIKKHDISGMFEERVCARVQFKNV